MLITCNQAWIQPKYFNWFRKALQQIWYARLNRAHALSCFTEFVWGAYPHWIHTCLQNIDTLASKLSPFCFSRRPMNEFISNLLLLQEGSVIIYSPSTEVYSYTTNSSIPVGQLMFNFVNEIGQFYGGTSFSSGIKKVKHDRTILNL